MLAARLIPSLLSRGKQCHQVMVTHRAVEDDAESGRGRVTPLRFLYQDGKPRIKGSSGGGELFETLLAMESMKSFSFYPAATSETISDGDITL